MYDGLPLGLVGEVRRLLEVEAPVDPDRAAVQFDRLVAVYGRAMTAAALMAVAPAELAELAHNDLHRLEPPRL